MAAFFKAHALLDPEAAATEAPPSNSEERTSEHSSSKRKIQPPRRSGYRRRADPYACKTVLSNAIEDGYAWRKYGQKIIHGAAHQRSYYRCAHKHNRGCQATRQVQRTENDSSMYAITYMGEHTCAGATKLPTCSASSELMAFQDFSDYEGSAPLAHFMGVASNQYDVTSGFQSPALEFDLDSFEMDNILAYFG